MSEDPFPVKLTAVLVACAHATLQAPEVTDDIVTPVTELTVTPATKR
jgi:hypothetical protein